MALDSCGITGIDHTLVGVRDLEAARATWTRLGFSVTPRGRHIGWGTGNYCVMLGVGSGMTALVLTAVVSNRWFETRRGLVVGVLTAAAATGQLVFLPVVAYLVEATSWKVASLLIAAAAVAVLPLVVVLLRDRQADLGLAPYGGDRLVTPPGPVRGNAAGLALAALRRAAHIKAFWALAGAFAGLRAGPGEGLGAPAGESRGGLARLADTQAGEEATLSRPVAAGRGGHRGP